MSRAKFRQVDVKRALLAAKAAGMNVSRSEIDAQGKIVLVFGELDNYSPTPAQQADREWANWKAKYRGKTEQGRHQRRPQNPS